MCLSHLIVGTLLPTGAALTEAVDDTLFKRRGRKVFGAAWQHDGPAPGPRGIGRGACFVVLALVVEVPFLARPVALPVATRLHRPKQDTSKVETAASMIRLLAACHHQRRIHVVADAAYYGRALRHLPAQVTLTTRIPANAVLCDPAPPPTGRRGRPALKGARLGVPADLAGVAAFAAATVIRYGRTDTVYLTEIRCLWYGSFHTQAVRVILVRETDTDTGYDLALVTTDPVTPATATTPTTLSSAVRPRPGTP